MRRFTVLLAALALTLPSLALACSPGTLRAISTQPILHEGVRMPLNGYVYLPPEASSLHLGTILHPDGSGVEWVIEDNDFDPDLQRVRPAGGWQVGQYFEVHSGIGAEDAVPTFTVEDAIDDTPPEVGPLTWRGHNAEPPALCGTSQGQGVTLAPTADEDVLWYRQITRDGEEPSGFALVTPWAHTVFGTAGEHYTVEYRAVDLAGNSSDEESADVVACSGCSGSFAGGGMFGLLPLLALIRRRSC